MMNIKLMRAPLVLANIGANFLVWGSLNSQIAARVL